MISAVISLICENSLAVLTTAKPRPAIIPIQFYSLVYETVPCFDQTQTTRFKPKLDDGPEQNWVFTVKLCHKSTLIPVVIISAIWNTAKAVKPNIHLLTKR